MIDKLMVVRLREQWATTRRCLPQEFDEFAATIMAQRLIGDDMDRLNCMAVGFTAGFHHGAAVYR